MLHRIARYEVKIIIKQPNENITDLINANIEKILQGKPAKKLVCIYVAPSQDIHTEDWLNCVIPKTVRSPAHDARLVSGIQPADILAMEEMDSIGVGW